MDSDCQGVGSARLSLLGVSEVEDFERIDRPCGCGDSERLRCAWSPWWLSVPLKSSKGCPDEEDPDFDSPSHTSISMQRQPRRRTYVLLISFLPTRTASRYQSLQSMYPFSMNLSPSTESISVYSRAGRTYLPIGHTTTFPIQLVSSQVCVMATVHIII